MSSRSLSLLLAAAAALTACTSSGRSSAGQSTSSKPAGSARSTPFPTAAATSDRPTTSAKPTACLDPSGIATWSVGRRAAEILAVPALSANATVVKAAVSEGAGAILLLGPMPGASSLVADLRAATTARSAGAGLAPLVMVDQEGGGVQRLGGDVISLPWARQMAATMTAAQVQREATVLGREMAGLGVQVDLAPVLDLDGGTALSTTDADGPRSFSTDPAVASSFGSAFAAGLRAGGVVPVLKHFPGLGGAEGNTDYGPAATRSYASLQSSGLVPFQHAIDAGAPAVMVANATVPGLTSQPASISPAVITGLLRDRWHFGGLVMTDSLSAGAISQAGYDAPAAAVASIEAGADLVLFGSTLTAAETRALAPAAVQRQTSSIVAAITAATESGRLSAGRLNQAVLHVLVAGGARLC